MGSDGNNGQAQGNSEGECDPWRNAGEHAWRYFELHANQRMTLFNFFTVLAGLMTAGIGTSMQGGHQYALFGVTLSVMLTLLAFVFWKIDQRMSFLIKHAEAAQVSAERHFLPKEAWLFSSEPNAMSQAQAGHSTFISQWTLGGSFRLVFTIAALIGAVSFIVCGLRV
ncbi:hypothetical protein ACOJBO_31590 [Rhizobium beringeri]